MTLNLSSPPKRAAPRHCARKAAPLKAPSTRVASVQLPSYEYDRKGEFACSRLPCCSTFNHIVSKTTRAKLKILGLFRPFHGELVHLQPSAHHGCLSVPWRIRSPAMEPRFEVKTCWERGAWGIHSARAVPAQCPRQCPPGN